jgi:hypothetical protein
VVALFVISGKLSIPALWSLIVRRQVPQSRLPERVTICASVHVSHGATAPNIER